MKKIILFLVFLFILFIYFGKGTVAVELCTTAGGTLVNNVCQFNSAQCPTNWVPDEGWSTTLSNTCEGGDQWCGGSCTIEGHGWSNKAAEICTYSTAYNIGNDCGSDTADCQTKITQIGCSRIFPYHVGDSFGLYYDKLSSNPLESNSPTNKQSKFSSSGMDLNHNWMISDIITPLKNKYNLVYEADTWMTSRGDLKDPKGPLGTGTSINYYNGEGNNYGGGVRVKSLQECNILNNCITYDFDYSGGPGRKAGQSSGVLNTVPIKSSGRSDESDLRRASHKGSPYVTGGVLYNVVTMSVEGVPGSIKNYFITTDSTPENTNNAIQESAEDENIGTLKPEYSYSSGRLSLSLDPAQRYSPEYLVPSIRSTPLIPISSNPYCAKVITKQVEVAGGAIQDIVDYADSVDTVIKRLDNLGSPPSLWTSKLDPTTLKCININPSNKCPQNIEKLNYFVSEDYFSCTCGDYYVIRERLLTDIQCVNNELKFYSTTGDGEGAQAGTSKSWMRGLNYKQEIITPYQKKEISRTFDIVEQIKERFGDKLVEGNYRFVVPNTFTGYSAGSVFPKLIESVTYPDLPSTTSFTQSIQYEDFDLKTGSPKTYIIKNKNLKDEKTVKSTLETSVNSEDVLMNYENKHMISYPLKVTISSDGVLLRELQYDYGLLSNGNIELIKETTSSSNGKKISSINGYDELGKLIKKIGNNGLITNFRYDNEGRIIKQWTSEQGNEANPLTEYSYDTYGRLKERKSNDGVKIEYEYDGLGRRTKEINNLDTKDKPTIQYIYFNPVQGKPIKTIVKTKLDENNYQELVEFKDGKDNIIQAQTKIKDKQYLVTAKKIDSQGRIIYVSKPFLEDTNGEYTKNVGKPNIEYVYENALLGRLIKKVYPDNSFTEFSYKAENGLPVIIATDQDKNVKKMTYDTQGNIIKLEEGPTLSLLSVTTTYEYDEQDRLVKIIDALGRTFIQNEYNDYGLTKSTSIDTSYIIMNYDEITGYLSNTKTPNNVVSYDYDLSGRIKKIEYG